MPCYCHSKKEFENCCQPLLANKMFALNAEALMRSRFTAFVLKDFEYLLKTHDPKTINEFDLQSNQAWASSVDFTKLEVLSAKESGNQAVVEFNAYFTEKNSGKSFVHHEMSDFRKENKLWYFVGGQ
jgi:SEC-C motif-containing protein